MSPTRARSAVLSSRMVRSTSGAMIIQCGRSLRQAVSNKIAMARPLKDEVIIAKLWTFQSWSWRAARTARWSSWRVIVLLPAGRRAPAARTCHHHQVNVPGPARPVAGQQVHIASFSAGHRGYRNLMSLHSEEEPEGFHVRFLFQPSQQRENDGADHLRRDNAPHRHHQPPYNFF